jgi:hypothetical protein
MTTPKQKAEVSFCEKMLDIEFTGNIEDKFQVLEFLSEYLQEAKDLYDELVCEYEAYLWELD